MGRYCPEETGGRNSDDVGEKVRNFPSGRAEAGQEQLRAEDPGLRPPCKGRLSGPGADPYLLPHSQAEGELGTQARGQNLATATGGPSKNTASKTSDPF